MKWKIKMSFHIYTYKIKHASFIPQSQLPCPKYEFFVFHPSEMPGFEIHIWSCDVTIFFYTPLTCILNQGGLLLIWLNKITRVVQRKIPSKRPNY